jgi:hypothetical protein
MREKNGGTTAVDVFTTWTDSSVATAALCNTPALPLKRTASHIYQLALYNTSWGRCHHTLPAVLRQHLIGVQQLTAADDGVAGLLLAGLQTDETDQCAAADGCI